MKRGMLGALLLCLAGLAGAQTTAGRISGTILDASGALAPGAKVTARNLETGVVRSAHSNAEGNYVLYPLAPGTYEVTFQAAGFRTERLERIEIDVAASVIRNLRLQLGPVEQQVVVSAEAAPMLTQSISVESKIVREQIDALPLNGRDFNQLVLLAAGAVENINSGDGKDFGAVAANGNRAFSNDYLLDGTPNNDVFQGRAGAPVSVDVIREFKVTSGVAPAEYGQAGTQVTVVTRSGANRVHGSVFEYHRGNTWEARNPFNTMGQQPFLRNQFGASLGGPLLLPGYNGRNRTFVFFNYEGNRNLSEALTHSSGRHTFKAGFELRRIHLPSLQQSNASGRISFSASATSANSSGYTFSDFLMGLPSSTQEVPVKEPILLKQTEIASFLQDDWRVTPRLTFSLGLRHELFLSPYEERNRLAMFDVGRGAIVVASDDGKLPVNEFLPAVVARLTDAEGKWRFPLLSDREASFNPRRLIDTQYNHWGPR